MLRQSEEVLQAKPSVGSVTSIRMESVVLRLSASADSILARTAQQDRGQLQGDNLFELSFCRTAKNIVTALSRHEAMLLPVAYRQFSQLVHLTSEHNCELPSMRWFVSRIHHYFGDTIVLECKHRRFGTIIYHKNCDIVRALSFALGQQQWVREDDHYNISGTSVMAQVQQVVWRRRPFSFLCGWG